MNCSLCRIFLVAFSIPVVSTLADSTSAQPPSNNLGVFEMARIIAVVGDQYILEGDLVARDKEGKFLGTVGQMLKQAEGQVPPEQIEAYRRQLTQQLLQPVVQRKVLYLDFLRTLPSGKLPDVQKQVFKQFDKTQLEPLMTQMNTLTRAELDAALRKHGTSLEKQRRAFMEKVLAQEMIRQNVDRDIEITHREMVDYYHAHAEDFRFPAQARWERIMVRFDGYPSKADAYRALAILGNRVALGGEELAEVARRNSQGPNADKGGYYDWTTKGSLRSTVIDEAIFSLPVGRLSAILEDESGFHIVRVLQRRQAGQTPFVDAQVKIKEIIHKKKLQEQIAEYIARAQKKVHVWTIFDDQPSEPNDAVR